MGKEKPGVLIYFSIRPGLEPLSLDEKGLLFDAILEYAEYHVEPAFDGSLAIVWAFVKPQIDKDDEAYTNKRDQNRRNAFMRWHANACDGIRTDATDTNTIQSSTIQSSTIAKERGADKPPARFVAPSVEEVQAYIDEHDYAVDAAAFVDYYTANGWVQGKGKPIKDWKAAVRTWARREKNDDVPESRMELVTHEDGTKTWRMKT